MCRADRERARAASEACAPDAFHEVHVKAALELCERRDPKGLYKRARKGELREFTGISAPYEPPDDPELIIDTGAENVDQCTQRIVEYVNRNFALEVGEH